METTDRLRDLEDGTFILKPSKGYCNSNDRIYIEFTEDTEDGTFPRISDYTRFCNKVNNHNYKSVQNFLIGKRKSYDCGAYILSKKNISYSNDGIKILFKEPQKVSFGSYKTEETINQVTENIKAIKGKISHNFYWLKNGRQNKIANGIELFIENLEFFKDEKQNLTLK